MEALLRRLLTTTSERYTIRRCLCGSGPSQYHNALVFCLQLIAPAANDIEIIVGKFAPLLFHLSFDLFPISLNPVPVHGTLL
jgi:hypothetical protein